MCTRLAILQRGHVVALARTSELLAQASTQVLRFKTDDALPPELAQLARVTGRVAQLPARDAQEIEHHLAMLRAAAVHVEDVEIRKVDLEDVFIHVMETARDDADGVSA
ncbi:MAG: hypothetical protein HKUEN07_36070 [Rhodocyclaceae bacterium]|nr:MAG: hypothetical protein HKUEN07_36070 [Rhodocyclaceae bacterium]